MAKPSSSGAKTAHTPLVKKTKQGGKVARSGMNKHEKRSFKAYRGQGR